MTTAFVGPLNILIGVATNFPAAEWPSPNQTGFIVMANNSSVALAVQTNNGSKWLYPNTADIVVPGGNNISLAALNQPVNSLYIGTVTATYYSDDEPVPGAYPQNLPTFLGGNNSMIANFALRPFPNNGVQLLASPTTIDVQPPPDTGQLLLTNLNFPPVGMNPSNITVTGDQSGTVYYNVNNPAGDTHNNLYITVNPAKDSTYSIKFSSNALPNANFDALFAIQSIALEQVVVVPPQAGPGAEPVNDIITLGVNGSAGSQSAIIAAPGVGKRLRIFTAKIGPSGSTNPNGMFFGGTGTAGGETFIAVAPIGSLVADNLNAPPTGLPMAPNTAINAGSINGTTSTFFGIIGYTIESV